MRELAIAGDITFTNKIKSVVLLMTLLAAGCRSADRTALAPTRRPLAPALLPLPRESSRGAAERDCGEQTIPAPGRIADLVVAYVSTGRSFQIHDDGNDSDTPDQQASAVTSLPDGYVIRVIPLDRQLRPAFAQAQLTIDLYAVGAGPLGQAGNRPLLTWQVAPSTAGLYWVKTRLLDGYVLRLDCGGHGPTPGRYH